MNGLSPGKMRGEGKAPDHPYKVEAKVAPRNRNPESADKEDASKWPISRILSGGNFEHCQTSIYRALVHPNWNVQQTSPKLSEVGPSTFM